MINKKLAAGLTGSICFINFMFAEATIVNDKLPLLTYADHIVYTYDRPNGSKKGNIAPSTSLVMIKKIMSDGWAYGSYKIANKNTRINGWFKMSDLQGYMDFKNYEATAYQDFVATRTRTGSYKLGHIAKNDKVIVVAEKGDSKKVIFTDEGNRYRMGWIPSYVLDQDKASNMNNNNDFSNDEFVAPDYGLDYNNDYDNTDYAEDNNENHNNGDSEFDDGNIENNVNEETGEGYSK